MRLPPRAMASMIVDLCEETPAKDHPELLENVVALLKKRGYAHRDLLILRKAIAKELGGRESTVSVTVTTVSGASSKSLQPILLSLERCLGKKVILEQRADSSILGGALIAFGDERIDASVRGTLERLTTSFALPLSL